MTGPDKPKKADGTPALSDLAATDALLDRLGAGTLGDDDLDDPAVAVLAELLSVVDDPAEVDGDVGRLMEVLDGRPLYLVGPDEAAAEELGEDAPISLGPPEPRVIDLTASTKAEEPEVLPAQRRWQWEKALQQVSLPAASVLILLVLGGGVSAVVTGDPMAPVNGVTRVVSALPGVQKPGRASAGQVERELNAAVAAARSNDKVGATRHLEAARKALASADLPEDQTARLAAIAGQVQTSIETGLPVAVPGDPGSGSVITTTTPPVVVVPTSPADPPPATASPTTPPATTPPTTEDSTPPTTPSTTTPAPTDTITTEATTESTPSAT